MKKFNLQMKDQEVFVYLMSVAQEEREIRDRIVSILTLKSDQRKELLDVLLYHTKLRQAPDELKKIFTFFLDDLFADEVLHYLKTHS